MVVRQGPARYGSHSQAPRAWDELLSLWGEIDEFNVADPLKDLRQR